MLQQVTRFQGPCFSTRLGSCCTSTKQIVMVWCVLHILLFPSAFCQCFSTTVALCCCPVLQLKVELPHTVLLHPELPWHALVDPNAVAAAAAPTAQLPVAVPDRFDYTATPGQRIHHVFPVLVNDSPQGYLRISGTSTTTENVGRITMTSTTLEYDIESFAGTHTINDHFM